MEKKTNKQNLGIFEVVIGFLSIGFSYWIMYEIGLRQADYWLSGGVILFLCYGLLGLKTGFDNLKQKGGLNSSQA
jgi:hypothetical protein